MRNSKSIPCRLLSILIAATVLWPLAAHAQSAAIDPEAVKILRQSTDYLASLKNFRMEAVSMLEVVTPDGQKLQFDHRTAATVQRPNKLRVDRIGELVSQTFYYDGKTLSVNLPRERYYAAVPAPKTLEETLDFARDQLSIIAPGADLLYRNAFDRLTDGLTGAMIVGESVVAGVRCDHLAFRNAEVDWQICIDQGKKPLPRKLVVTSKKMKQAPQFIVLVSRWETAPKVDKSTFDFSPAKGAMKIDFIQPASRVK